MNTWWFFQQKKSLNMNSIHVSCLKSEIPENLFHFPVCIMSRLVKDEALAWTPSLCVRMGSTCGFPWGAPVSLKIRKRVSQRLCWLIEAGQTFCHTGWRAAAFLRNTTNHNSGFDFRWHCDSHWEPDWHMDLWKLWNAVCHNISRPWLCVSGAQARPISWASLDHNVLLESVYLMFKLKKIHVVLLSNEVLLWFLFVLRGIPPLPAMCWEACVVACLRASVWSGEQTERVVVLWWRCSLRLPRFAFRHVSAARLFKQPPFAEQRFSPRIVYWIKLLWNNSLALAWWSSNRWLFGWIVNTHWVVVWQPHDSSATRNRFLLLVICFNSSVVYSKSKHDFWKSLTECCPWISTRLPLFFFFWFGFFLKK